MKHFLLGRGYPAVRLPDRQAKVHHLMLDGFVGPRPPGCDGCHWDDNKTDNRLFNLRWDTKSANERDKVRNGRHPATRRTHCVKGHEFTPENMGIRSGKRYCRACTRDRSRKWREQRKDTIT